MKTLNDFHATDRETRLLINFNDTLFRLTQTI